MAAAVAFPPGLEAEQTRRNVEEAHRRQSPAPAGRVAPPPAPPEFASQHSAPPGRVSPPRRQSPMPPHQQSQGKGKPGGPAESWHRQQQPQPGQGGRLPSPTRQEFNAYGMGMMGGVPQMWPFEQVFGGWPGGDPVPGYSPMPHPIGPCDGYPPQMAPNANSAPSAMAALEALQKFKVAEEVRQVGTTRQPQAKGWGGKGLAAVSKDEQLAAELTRMLSNGLVDSSAEYERRRRFAAEAKAEATVARIQELREQQMGHRETSAVSSSSPVIDGAAERYIGTIKSFNLVTGFGFIQSDDLQTKYGSDAFLNQAVDGGIVVGGRVSFTVEENKNGKPQARNVRLEAVGVDGPTTVTADMLAAKESVSALQAHMVPGKGMAMRGRVKSFNVSRGFGFITCPELQYAFGGRDIYVSQKEVHGEALGIGQEVEFELVLDAKGQPQAKSVIRLAKKKPNLPGPPPGNNFKAYGVENQRRPGMNLFGK